MEAVQDVTGVDDIRKHPLWNEQRRLEKMMDEDGIARYDHRKGAAIKRKEESAIPANRETIRIMLGPTCEAMTAALLKYKVRGGPDIALKILGLFGDVETIAYITAKLVFDQISRPQSFQSVAIKVGHALETELRFRDYRREGRETFDAVMQNQHSRLKGRHHIEYVVKAIMTARGATFEAWPTDVRFHVGTRCIDLFQTQGLIEITTPVHTKRKKSTMRTIHATEAGLVWLAEQDALKRSMHPVYMPMVIPPREWDGIEGGGYYFKNLKIVRTPYMSHFNYVEDMPPMPDVYRAVNAIQNTAWKINRQVASVMLEAWANKSQVGGLPMQDAHPTPAKPITLYVRDAPEWRKYRDDMMETERLNRDLRDARLVVTHTLAVAQRMHRYDAIYFPHQLDFRGRVYPTPIYMHPQDADFSRALLTFSEGKPLGKDGAYWLAVHGANCWGEDKVSLDDRVKWIHDNTDWIERCAQHPLEYREWADADKPWQFLAFAFEWWKYMSQPSTFVSHLPVDMDGTCNGLQHFSAMLRDECGGEAVNLTATALPQDIYQRVANRVYDKLVASDSPLAGPWLPFMDRKLTKRSVMIMPYGGTLHACRDYVGQAVLEKIKKGTLNPFPGKRLRMPVMFLSKLVWESIGDEVKKAREAMVWLQTVARAMTDKGLPVSWFTPAGFRAMQLYPEVDQYRIRTFLHGVETKFQLNFPIDESLDGDAQYTGIAPNFVHSMDGSALMVTVNHCVERGMTAFHMVHDSYGTHAADTRGMGEMLRGAFYQMYKDHDPLAELRATVLPFVGEGSVPPVPAPGVLDLAQVLRSRYFFA